MVHEAATAPLFDVLGRRIASATLGAAVNPPSDRYALVQPPIDYSVIYGRISEHLPTAKSVSRDEFEHRARALRDKLCQSEATAELAKAVYLPFVLGAARHADIGKALEETYLPAVGRSYQAQFPKYTFRNELKGLAGNVRIAAGSRHERLIEAMAAGPVVGLYFPLALSGYSFDAALKQMPDLPDGAMLSGGYDACAALAGCPELVMKTDAYAPQLDLAALQSPAAGYGYHFAPYGYNLTFNGRYHIGLASDYCTSGLTWISQKF